MYNVQPLLVNFGADSRDDLSMDKFFRSTGLTSLRKMTIACGYADIIRLMSDNVDFIMHRAALRLRHLQPNTKVFDVFRVIIVYSRKDSLPVLCDVIEVNGIRRCGRKIEVEINAFVAYYSFSPCWRATIFCRTCTAPDFCAYSPCSSGDFDVGA